MRRVALAVVFLLYALAFAVPLSAAQETDACTATVNNSTVQDLCERLQNKNQRINKLQNDKANLETKVVEKNARIQKLEFQLEQSNKSTGFSAREAEELKEIGAWNPREQEPAFMMWVDSENGGLYTFVGPGNGGHSFNGMNAWQRTLSGDVSITGNITFTLPYAPEGIKKEQKIVNGLNSNAAAEIRKLIDRFNRPATRHAWEQYNNEKRHSAESEDLLSNTMSHGAVLGIGVFLMYVESRKHFLFNRKKDKEEEEQRSVFEGDVEETSPKWKLWGD